MTNTKWMENYPDADKNFKPQKLKGDYWQTTATNIYKFIKITPKGEKIIDCPFTERREGRCSPILRKNNQDWEAIE